VILPTVAVNTLVTKQITELGGNFVFYFYSDNQRLNRRINTSL